MVAALLPNSLPERELVTILSADELVLANALSLEAYASFWEGQNLKNFRVLSWLEVEEMLVGVVFLNVLNILDRFNCNTLVQVFLYLF